jgi:hypothetical protein
VLAHGRVNGPTMVTSMRPRSRKHTGTS